MADNPIEFCFEGHLPTVPDLDRLFAHLNACVGRAWHLRDPDLYGPGNGAMIYFDTAHKAAQTLHSWRYPRSQPILGTFMFQLSDEKAQPEGEPIGPLSFDDAVALLITDHEAHAHEARELLIGAARDGARDRMSAITRKGVRITYSV